MSGQTKTKNLLRVEVPIALLEDNPDNPNQMSDKEFNLLVANIEAEGFTENVVCAPKDLDDLNYFREMQKQFKKDLPALWDQMAADGKKFRITSGHHRKKAAQFLDFVAVPSTIILNEEFDADQQDFQLVRHNVIHGKMSPSKFMSLYNKHEAKYGAEVMAELFGFADQDLLDELIDQAEKSLPNEMKKKFKEAAAEIKTVDDLAKLLNTLFTAYGDTLPYGFMFLDYGGKQSVWLRINKKTLDAAHVVGDRCVHEKRTVDDVLGRILQLIATGKAEEFLSEVVKSTPPADIPEGFKGMPTADVLEKVEGVD